MLEKEILDASFETEQQAMIGDKTAILKVISALRKYREISQNLLKVRYSDGFIDGVSSINFECTIEEIETDLGAD